MPWRSTLVSSNFTFICSWILQLTLPLDVGVAEVDLQFIRRNAESVLAASFIDYLKGAVLHGKLFQADSDTSAISSVFTQFYVDHAEPLEALEKYKARGAWCLGELLDGHEFLALFPVAPLSPLDLY